MARELTVDETIVLDFHPGRDLPLCRVNDARFSHTLIQRILGTGALTVESAGENGQLVLKNSPDVERVQREMYELINGPVRP